MTDITGFKVGEVTLQPLHGDIKQLAADAIVQPAGTSPRGTSLEVAPWVIESDTDDAIVKALYRHAPLQLGAVIVTGAGALKARYLFHAVVIDWAHQHPSRALVVDTIVSAVAKKCIAVAMALGIKSIAFTPWGTRVGGIDPSYVTALLVQAVAEALQEGAGDLQTVYFVSNKPEHYQWFVDRTLVFRIVYDQLSRAAAQIASLHVPGEERDAILSILRNVQRNIVVYNQVVHGDKYEVDVANSCGISIGDGASASAGPPG